MSWSDVTGVKTSSNSSMEFNWNLVEGYHHLMVNLRDKRSDSFPMMESVWPTFSICVLYVLFVKYAGPRMMKNRAPYSIKGLMLVYNICQTIFSLWGFIQGWKFYVSGDYNWLCQPIDYSTDYEAMRALNMAWWFYMSKFVDMLDSLFFVLTKKFSHLSFLHVFHHGVMPFQCWWGPRFVGGGHGGFAAFFNSGVHVVMYAYYALAACGPSVQKYLWWKKYLTTLQLLQFVCVFLHALLPLYFQCDYPKIMPLVVIANAVIFFTLFANFYFFAYIRKQSNEFKKTL